MDKNGKPYVLSQCQYRFIWVIPDNERLSGACQCGIGTVGGFFETAVKKYLGVLQPVQAVFFGLLLWCASGSGG